MNPLRDYLNAPDSATLKDLKQLAEKKNIDFRFLIVCIPDPVDTAQGYRFDLLVDALQNALKTDTLEIDRHFIPWNEYQTRLAIDPRARLDPSLKRYEAHPGLLLFRDGRPPTEMKKRRVLLTFLVGETPTFGIHSKAFHKSVELINDLAPTCQSPEVPVLGPFFSGTAQSLAQAIQEKKATNRFRVISGSATNVDPDHFEAWSGGTTYQSVQARSKDLRQELLNYVTDRVTPQNVSIAWLTESNTSFGGFRQPGTDEPRIIEFPFPLNISRFRTVYHEKESRTQPVADPWLEVLKRHRLSIPLDDLDTARDVVPQTTPEITAATVELVLSEILTTINREKIPYVGITATDARDRIFLASLIRRYCPNTQLMVLLSDILYNHPDYNSYLKGMLVASPYPLHPKDQRWTNPFEPSAIVQFAHASQQGFYNAALALLHESNQLSQSRPLLLGYATPFDHKAESARPAIWISVVGNNGFWPLRYRPIDLGSDSAKVMYEDTKGKAARKCHLDKTPAADPLRKLGGALTAYDGPSLMLMLGLLLLSACIALACLNLNPWKWRWMAYFAPRAIATYDRKRKRYLLLILIPFWALMSKQAVLTAAPIIHMEFYFEYINILYLLFMLILFLASLFVSSCLFACIFLLSIEPSFAPRWKLPGRIGTGGLLTTVLVGLVAYLLPKFAHDSFLNQWLKLEPLDHAVLWFERTAHIYSGVSLFVPAVFLALAFFIWGFYQLKKIYLLEYFCTSACVRHPNASENQLEDGLPLACPWPVQGAEACAHQGSRTRSGGLENELECARVKLIELLQKPCETLRRYAFAWFAVVAVLVLLWVSRLLVISLPPYEHQAWSVLLWSGFVVFLFVWSFWWLEVLFLMGWLRDLLRALERLPLEESFKHLPKPIASLIGRFLEGHEPGLEHQDIAWMSLTDVHKRRNDGDCPDAVKDLLQNDVKRLLQKHGVESLTEVSSKDRVALLESISQSLWEPMRNHWEATTVREAYPETHRASDEESHQSGGPPTRALDSARCYKVVEEFLAIQIIIYISQFFVHARQLLIGLTLSSFLVLFAVLSYPLHPHQLLVTSCTAMVITAVVTGIVIIVQMEYDPLVSYMAKTAPNQIKFDWKFLGRIALFVVPLVLILAGRAFPEALSWLTSVLDPILQRSQ